jgi:5'-phosphate synthase pdxT subunit
MSDPRVAVLALQGDFAAHADALAQCGARPVEVRVAGDLDGCAGLLIPGGESTTLLRLLEPYGLFDAIPAFHRGGGALFGTCAGAVLLAREVSPALRSFGLIDITVQRNAYGRQRESFEASATSTGAFAALEDDGAPARLPMLFIRAPRIVACANGVEVLATLSDDAVLVRQGRVMACTGHPELTPELRVHRIFVETLCAGERQRNVGAGRPKRASGARSAPGWGAGLTAGAPIQDHDREHPGSKT